MDTVGSWGSIGGFVGNWRLTALSYSNNPSLSVMQQVEDTVLFKNNVLCLNLPPSSYCCWCTANQPWQNFPQPFFCSTLYSISTLKIFPKAWNQTSLSLKVKILCFKKLCLPMYDALPDRHSCTSHACRFPRWKADTTATEIGLTPCRKREKRKGFHS